MNSGEDNPCGLGYPIRRSQRQSFIAARLGLSQRNTSFVASVNLGIRHAPLSYCDLIKTLFKFCHPRENGGHLARAELSQPEGLLSLQHAKSIPCGST